MRVSQKKGGWDLVAKLTLPPHSSCHSLVTRRLINLLLLNEESCGRKTKTTLILIGGSVRQPVATRSLLQPCDHRRRNEEKV